MGREEEMLGLVAAALGGVELVPSPVVSYTQLDLKVKQEASPCPRDWSDQGEAELCSALPM